jgi:hypothetical protein
VSIDCRAQSAAAPPAASGVAFRGLTRPVRGRLDALGGRQRACTEVSHAGRMLVELVSQLQQRFRVALRRVDLDVAATHCGLFDPAAVRLCALVDSVLP